MTDVLIPPDQAEGTTSVVAVWFKRVGDPVRANEPLLELSTDKVTVEIAAPADGVLLEIVKAEGEAVQPGEVVGRVGNGEAVEPGGVGVGKRDPRGENSGVGRSTGHGVKPPAAPARPADETRLSPAVRRLLREHGLEASQVQGTGRDGRITAEDVERAVGRSATEGQESGAAGRVPARSGARIDSSAPLPPRAPTPQSGIPSRLVPHSQMRRSIAAHMVQSVATAPHVTTVFDADLSRVLLHRERHRADAEARGARLTLTAYFVQASVRALQAVPEVNSRWHEDALELFEDCNIGVGTALEDGGLIVPVVHRAQDLGLLETADRLHDLTTRARAGRLTPSDVQQGTFTISNHGVSGSIVAAPIIIHQPQAAILGLGRMERRVVVREAFGHEVTEIRPMIYVTLTIDHRVLDGFQANRFLAEWVRVVEAWGPEGERGIAGG